jgi:hypothetical protein
MTPDQDLLAVYLQTEAQIYLEKKIRREVQQDLRRKELLKLIGKVLLIFVLCVIAMSVPIIYVLAAI